jgi:hypothetical protein
MRSATSVTPQGRVRDEMDAMRSSLGGRASVLLHAARAGMSVRRSSNHRAAARDRRRSRAPAHFFARLLKTNLINFRYHLHPIGALKTEVVTTTAPRAPVQEAIMAKKSKKKGKKKAGKKKRGRR